MLEFKWSMDYYMMFTFMLDATTFTNISKQGSHGGEKVFKRRGVDYPPEDIKAGHNVRDACHLMAYTVLHPFLGVVLGPDFVYTGSSATNKQWDRSGSLRGKHAEGFGHWCVAPLWHMQLT